ncbi:MAG TPA: DUF763 domain-containing protein [Vicinamibacterales bacterium]|nr:DUF763 domain-containing protein [Vicinamibacterales bacterium]
MRSGTAQLPLHTGRAPAWLFSRMVLLAREITAHLVAEYGSDEVLRRLSDPYWFQAFGCVLGFDWHSSGVTTTVTGALKEALRGREHELGVFAGGGKGAVSRRTPSEIVSHCERLSVDPAPLVYASRMSAKVDSAAVQDGYQLYHHAFFFTPSGSWCVVQQGMNGDNKMARRYHWLSRTLDSFVNEPHAAVCADTAAPTLNLVAAESAEVRGRAAEISREQPKFVLSALRDLPLLSMPRRHAVLLSDVNPQHLERVLLKTYEAAPRDFESLIGLEGVGARTVRALALVSEVIYGTAASTRDPARFSFALGGKDGTPFPVDRAAYDKTIDVLHAAVNRANIDRSERVKALKRLVAYGKAKVLERQQQPQKPPETDGQEPA